MIQEAQVFGIIPPAIPGMGNTGGLQLELEDRKSLGPEELQKAVEALLANYHNEPAVASMSSMYQANVPQYFLNIDRDKVQLMGLQLNQVFSTLGYYMGQAYVNDFVEFGRIYQVKLEAGEQAQKVIDDVLKLSVVNSKGEMVPFSSFTQIEQKLGMDQINRYNMYSAASITCTPAAGSSSGQAIEAMGSLIKNQLGGEFGYEWTSVAYQETQAGNTTTIILIMALLVAIWYWRHSMKAGQVRWLRDGASGCYFGSDVGLLGDGGSGEYLYPDRYYSADSLVCEEWYLDCGVRP